MRTIRILSILVIFLYASGCIREDFETPDGGMKIELGAKVNSVVVSTKASMDMGDTFDSDPEITLILLRVNLV